MTTSDSKVNRHFTRLLAIAAVGALAMHAKAEGPATLMTTRGKLLASPDFTAIPAPFTGKPAGFASGFSGWRYNSSATAGKGGRWEIANGEFRGIETPGANYPATASFGMTFQDVVIQCEVRLNDVPDEGRKFRTPASGPCATPGRSSTANGPRVNQDRTPSFSMRRKPQGSELHLSCIARQLPPKH
jgi:hypothetical protein